MKIILTIAGFDPSSGAGVSADLAVIAAHRRFGTAAITALTVQSTLGVEAVYPADPSVLRDTLACIAGDLLPAGVKLGMLAIERNVEVVADFLAALRATDPNMPIVLDPVLKSSSGRELLSPAGLNRMVSRLIPLVGWITPNRQELAALTDLEVSTHAGVEAAAGHLSAQFPGLNIVATGGDCDGADDLVLSGGTATWLHGEKVLSRATHGTGCAFSAALLCGLVAGRGGLDAARQAKAYVAEAIRRAEPLGHGRGPLNLLWPLEAER